MKILSVLVLAIGFIQCASTQFDKNPSFTITSATYTNWAGGVEGVNGTNVIIGYTADENVNFDSIFFRGRKAKISYKGSDNQKYIMAQFNTSAIQNKRDLQLHSNGAKEYGNQPPNTQEKFPFELKNDEAVVSYLEGGKIKYFKIENLQKGKQKPHQ
ncbi:hypothetical protein [Tenacibaculum sp. IB213877]|uniref:hypothetical protein n=1 Tax=Tenacibaculum sp. IB213877 TaxID=3097351 RepID=UPI002A59A04C|nr:hypothetical protein [Tenacibaculum sp. IB213877]MDY0780441.1 hypothetical protein [Tenacibaculum sp. IB213877]